MGTDKRDSVLKILKENPDGLTIQDIAKMGKMSRITATVYIQGLLGEGVASERKIGVYRLIFPSSRYAEAMKSSDLIRKLEHKVK